VTPFPNDERLNWAQTRGLIRSDLDRLAKHLGQSHSFLHRVYFFMLPGFLVLFLHRLSRYAYLKGWAVPARLLALLGLHLTHAEIPPTTSIGPSALIPHAPGISLFGKIGARVTINGAGATGGGFGIDDIGGGPGYPVLGDDVVLAYGAYVLGPVRIGDGVHIGPGTLVTFDVPDNGLVLWDRPRVIRNGATHR
jgi:serine O-acetyltransferase